MLQFAYIKRSLFKATVFLIFSFLPFERSFAGSINFQHNDAVVWHYKQTVKGHVKDFSVKEVTVYHNQNSFAVKVEEDNTFTIDLILKEEENKIWVEVQDKKKSVISDTLRYTLGYKPLPIVKPHAKWNGKVVELRASTLENPYNYNLRYLWEADSRNPAATVVSNPNDSIATVNIPEVEGKYYFNLMVITQKDTARYRTYITRTGTGLQPFKIGKTTTSWMNDACIYQITPYNFVEDGKYKDITAKLPELKELGINTVWLQPVFKASRKGQGYDVVDYLGLNPDLGTEEELRELIATAKELDMRVLFDVVLNHTSIYHPYAQDRIKNGTRSHYYDFYQKYRDNKPYSSHYNEVENDFIVYFWKELPNLNYDNVEVQRWITEVVKYWVTEFGIDGYRLDAIWGVNSRNPSFARRMITELKAVNPDILLLAEDKGNDPVVFELGYDAGYDWTADTMWVSQWSWEYQWDPKTSHTIFNNPNVSKRGELLLQALFDNGGEAYRQLRFMENNDLPRFIVHHQIERTKLAAALLFSIPGIPMLYNGQEIGFTGHPYGTHKVFDSTRSIREQDNTGLFEYYQKLIRLRKDHPALRSERMRKVSVSPLKSLVALHRSSADETMLVLINLDEQAADAEVDLRKAGFNIQTNKTALEDILNGDSFKVKRNKPVKIPMEGYSVRYILLK